MRLIFNAIYVSLLFLFIFLFSCSKSSTLNPLISQVIAPTPSNVVSLDFCVDAPKQTVAPVKYIIIFDSSGSNILNGLFNPNNGYFWECENSFACCATSCTDASTLASPVSCSCATHPSPLWTSPVNLLGPNGTSQDCPLYKNLATDPNGTFRFGVDPATASGGQGSGLLQYLTNPLPTPSPSFYAILFGADVFRQSTPASGSGSVSIPTHFMSAAEFYPLVQQFQQNVASDDDHETTNYTAALNGALSVITNDLANKQLAQYVIIFVTDGSPFVKLELPRACPDHENSISFTRQTDAEILSIVSEIKALQLNNTYSEYIAGINLYTVYYYATAPHPNPIVSNVDIFAASTLQQMANYGEGYFLNVDSNGSLDYNQFKPSTTNVQFSLSDLTITNSAVTYWTDGKLHADSDQDGLPDDIELQSGFNPFLKDTNNNGISDYVEYQILSQKQDGFGACTNTATSPTNCSYASLANIQGVPTTRPSPINPNSCSLGQIAKIGGSGIYDSDCDGLNDWEEALLGRSDGSLGHGMFSDVNTLLSYFLPDWLVFKNRVSVNPNAVPLLTSPQADGYSIYTKIKLSLPTAISLSTLTTINNTTYTTSITNPGQNPTCYHVEVNNLPRLKDVNPSLLIPESITQDQIRIDILIKGSSGATAQDRYHYYNTLVSFPANQQKLQVTDWHSPNPSYSWSKATTE